MGKKRDIIILIICGVIFFTVYSVSYYVKNYSTLDADINILRSEQVKTETTTTFTKKTTPCQTLTTVVSDKAAATEPDTAIFIDINTATKEELMRLHGIGDVLSSAIINYRNINGRFNNIDELLFVEGIGEGILSDIRGNIYVTDPYYPPTENEYYVYTEEDNAPDNYTDEQIEEYTDSASPINLNTADTEQLTALPHINEEKAQKIIELREKIGGFSSFYELLLVDGLTQAQVSDIKDYIIIE